MGAKKPIYRTVIQIEILSDEKYNVDTPLSDIEYDINEGSCSGKQKVKIDNEVLYGEEAVKEIVNQGSDPEFFGIDGNGKELN